MKTTSYFTAIAAAILMPIAVEAADLSAKITDAKWNGQNVPNGQQCNKFGGKAMSPPLKVTNIPANANALVLSFDDRSYGPMNHGGHGQIIYDIKLGAKNVNVPSVAPHTFDLPNGFRLLAAHRAPSWDTAGAYMPPCSGGQGNEYVVVVKAAIVTDGKVKKSLAKVDVAMGRY